MILCRFIYRCCERYINAVTSETICVMDEVQCGRGQTLLTIERAQENSISVRSLSGPIV